MWYTIFMNTKKKRKWSDRPYWKERRRQAKLAFNRANGIKAGRPKLEVLECTNPKCELLGRHVQPCKVYMTEYQRRRRERIKQDLNPKKHVPITDLSWVKGNIYTSTLKELEEPKTRRKSNRSKESEDISKNS